MPSKETTTANAVYLPPPDGVDVEAAKPPVFGTSDHDDAVQIKYRENRRGKITAVDESMGEFKHLEPQLKNELNKLNDFVVVKRAAMAKLQEEVRVLARKQRAVANALRASKGWRSRFATFCLWLCSFGIYEGADDWHVARDAAAEEQKHEEGVLNWLTAVIETASEGTDVWFTLTTLKNLADPFLYTASISVLSLQVALRFLLAMSPLVLFRDKDGDVFGKGSNPRRYLWGVALTMVSPNNGVKVINSAMNLHPGTGSRDGDSEYHARDVVARAYQLEVALFALSFIQIFAEDIPEAAIDSLYLAQTDWNFAPGELETFATTAALTLISVVRGIFQARFAWKNLKRVPRVLDHERTPLQKLLRGETDEDANWFQRRVGRLLKSGRTPLDVLTMKGIRTQPEHKYYTPVVNIGESEIQLEPWNWAGVRSLFLDECGLGDKVDYVKKLSKAINNGRTSLELASLRDNKLTDESGKELAKALTQNTTLTTLYLGANQLTDETGKEFATALKQNTTLTYLYLGANQLTDETGKEFATALKQNTTLTYLYLQANQLTDASRTAIREAWGDRSSMLYLSDGDI